MKWIKILGVGPYRDGQTMVHVEGGRVILMYTEDWTKMWVEGTATGEDVLRLRAEIAEDGRQIRGTRNLDS